MADWTKDEEFMVVNRTVNPEIEESRQTKAIDHAVSGKVKIQGFTQKQYRFVQAFCGEACGSSTRAAKLAGYKGTDLVLRQIGGENLKKPHILKAIMAMSEEDPLVANRVERQRFWTSIMRQNDPDKIANMDQRIKASELLAKACGDFITKIEANGQIKVTMANDPDLSQMSDGDLKEYHDTLLHAAEILERSKNRRIEAPTSEDIIIDV